MISDLFEIIKGLDLGALIVIEGACGSGKTTVAQSLSKELKIQYIDTDCYIVKQSNSEHYVSLLDIEHLKEVILTFITRKKTIVFSGICAQEILQQLSFSPTFKIYVKPIDSDGTWRYGVDIDEIIEDGTEMPEQQPYQSDMKYHIENKPHENADFIYEYTKDETHNKV